MGKLLNVEEGEHLIEKYSLKPLDLDDKNKDSNEEIVDNSNNFFKESIEANKINNFDISLFEDLSKKNDELLNHILSIKQEIQEQSQDCKNQLAQIQDLSYKNGYNDGYNKAKAENEIKERISKLIESISKIDEVYKEYENKAANIEKELVSVAIDIAEQITATEVSKNSKQIALNLTKELINDIKKATKIEIKVNPIDYEYVKENLQLEKVKITPDSAISPGGVVILSDSGNIEAEISDRFKTIKNNILKG
jgi:flagellar assembly protein FliH